MSLILFDHHLAFNLISVLQADNWVFLDSHLLNSNSVGTNYTVSSYYLQFEPDTSKLLTAILLPSGFLYGRIFYFLVFNKKVFLIWAGSIIASQDLASLFTKLSGKL